MYSTRTIDFYHLLCYTYKTIRRTLQKQDGADNDYHSPRKTRHREDIVPDRDSDTSRHSRRRDRSSPRRDHDRICVRGKLRDKRGKRRKRQKEIDGTGRSIHRHLARIPLWSRHISGSADSITVRSLRRTADRKPRRQSSGLSLFWKRMLPGPLPEYGK